MLSLEMGILKSEFFNLLSNILIEKIFAERQQNVMKQRYLLDFLFRVVLNRMEMWRRRPHTWAKSQKQNPSFPFFRIASILTIETSYVIFQLFILVLI